jgi:hypothetical protein
MKTRVKLQESSDLPPIYMGVFSFIFLPYVPLRSPLVPCAPLRSRVVFFTSVGFLQVLELSLCGWID